MTSLDSAISLIEILRNINRHHQTFNISEGARFFSSTYKEITDLYRLLKACPGIEADLFLYKLKCELTSLNKYNDVTNKISSEIDLFNTWYLDQSELIDSLFSEEVISSIIEEEVDYMYGKELVEAKQNFSEAIQDEKIWHRLARAYGSRQSGMPLDQEDLEYINPSLEEYKKHFGVSQVDLPEMYKEYETKMKPQYLQCRTEVEEIQKKCREFRNKISTDYECDVYAKIYSHLAEYYSYLGIGKDESNDMGKEPKVRYAIYSNLSECIPRKEIYEKVIKLSDSYLLKHKHIDGVFGITVFNSLKTNGWINNKGCTQAHFGELLIKEFGSKCSFTNGGAISDAKDTEDKLLIKEINNVFRPSE